MGSKIAAAHLAAGAGIPTVIASGQAQDVLVPIVAGERRGTRFDGRAAPGESAFKLWIRHGKRPRGSVVLDAGAEQAVRAAGASVLAVGVTACDGGFGPGDAIELVSAKGVPIGKGIASIAAADVGSRARGLEVVNRDRLVLY
jgi:glutamate 5-kinase